MNRPLATIKTARMSDIELLSIGFTKNDIEAGLHLPEVSGGTASTHIITDMNSVITNGNSTTALNAAIAAAGPIIDLPGMLQSVRLNFQEATEKLAYILQGSMIQTGTPPITAPTGGLITSTSDSTNYNLLVGIYQLLY